MTKIYNKKSEQLKRRELRNNPTYAEKILWLSLRNRQIHGVRFLRQFSIFGFVVDFYSPEVRLAIEVDGISHRGKEEYDSERQKIIESLFIKVIRYTDEQVIEQTEKVIDSIKEIVGERLKSKSKK
ncbi:MAG: endonuclease domain-containing protein [Actinobacteria bacterium]|nr:endonuclease domain-containing protein [Actinomycetota bacterium]